MIGSPFGKRLAHDGGIADISATVVDLDPELLKSVTASSCGLVVDRMKKPAIAGRLRLVVRLDVG